MWVRKSVHGLPQVGRGRAGQQAGWAGGTSQQAGRQLGGGQAGVGKATEQQRWAEEHPAAGEETGIAMMTTITRIGAAVQGLDLGMQPAVAP